MSWKIVNRNTGEILSDIGQSRKKTEAVMRKWDEERVNMDSIITVPANYKWISCPKGADYKWKRSPYE